MLDASLTRSKGPEDAPCPPCPKCGGRTYLMFHDRETRVFACPACRGPVRGAAPVAAVVQPPTPPAVAPAPPTKPT